MFPVDQIPINEQVIVETRIFLSVFFFNLPFVLSRPTEGVWMEKSAKGMEKMKGNLVKNSL